MTQYKVIAYEFDEIENSISKGKNLFPQGVGTIGIDIWKLNSNNKLECKMLTKDINGTINFGKGIASINEFNQGYIDIKTSNPHTHLKNTTYTITSQEKLKPGLYSNFEPAKYSVLAKSIDGNSQVAKGHVIRFDFKTSKTNLTKNDINLLYDYTCGMFPKHPFIKRFPVQKKSLKNQNKYSK